MKVAIGASAACHQRSPRGDLNYRLGAVELRLIAGPARESLIQRSREAVLDRPTSKVAGREESGGFADESQPPFREGSAGQWIEDAMTTEERPWVSVMCVLAS